MYQIRILDVAERELAQLDKTVGRRIVKRIRWLAENVEDVKAAEPCAIRRFPY
jgi:mRNA-degrading endonuclease RelE of RelBE toxin-antitoxin system